MVSSRDAACGVWPISYWNRSIVAESSTATIAAMRELILTFHGLGEPPEGLTQGERNVWVPVEWFARILDQLPGHGVEIAFDDGNASDLVHALPLLARAGRTARFFVLAGRIGAPGLLGEAGVVALREAGMTIGSHGLHHRDWRTLPRPELIQEVAESRRRLSELVGADVDEAACPFGSYDRRVLGALRSAGYRRVFTSDGGRTSTRAWLASRSSVHRQRPLEEWCALARDPLTGFAPELMQLGKRAVKRLR